MSGSDGLSPMRPWRKVLVTSFVVVLVLGQAYDGLRGKSHWPFQPFHMFSLVSHSRHTAYRRIVGVDEAGREVAFADPAYSDPIRIFHARIQFGRKMDLTRNRCQTLAEMSREFLARYERHRVAGRHAGPKLVGLRLYEMSWNAMDPWARNADHPDKAELLFDSNVPCDDRAAPAKSDFEGRGVEP